MFNKFTAAMDIEMWNEVCNAREQLISSFPSANHTNYKPWTCTVTRKWIYNSRIHEYKGLAKKQHDILINFNTNLSAYLNVLRVCSVQDKPGDTVAIYEKRDESKFQAVGW